MSKSILEAPDRNFWLCRADSGRFYEHFNKHNVIALGHLTFDILRQWLIKNSADLKDHLALAKPGSSLDVKEFENK